MPAACGNYQWPAGVKRRGRRLGLSIGETLILFIAAKH